MAYYRSCPDCGVALDPGEKCDCYMHTEPQSGKSRSETQKSPSDGFCISRAGQRQSQRTARIRYAR